MFSQLVNCRASSWTRHAHFEAWEMGRKSIEFGSPSAPEEPNKPVRACPDSRSTEGRDDATLKVREGSCKGIKSTAPRTQELRVLCFLFSEASSLYVFIHFNLLPTLHDFRMAFSILPMRTLVPGKKQLESRLGQVWKEALACLPLPGTDPSITVLLKCVRGTAVPKDSSLSIPDWSQRLTLSLTWLFPNDSAQAAV